jgi:putative DNA primase/helicase
MSQTREVTIRLKRSGVWRVDGQHSEKVAEPIRVRALGTRVVKGKEVHCRELRFKTRNGVYRKEILDESEFLGNSDLVGTLADAGYIWPQEQQLRKAIIAKLQKSRPTLSFRAVEESGWHGNDFLLPGRRWRAPGSERIVILDPQAANDLAPFILGPGSLKGWRKQVARPARQSTRLMCAISLAFTAPILRLLGLDSFGINFYGSTSSGKTSALKIAAFVAGLLGDQGLPSWGDTEVGIEDQACGHRDRIFPLDETADAERGTVDPKVKLRAITFLIGRNRSRKKAKDHGVIREFKVVLASTSERRLSAIAAATGGSRLAGEEVRLSDVCAVEPGSFGIFDQLKEDKQGWSAERTHDLVTKLVQRALTHQGYPFRAFIRKLQRDKEAVETLKHYVQDFEAAQTLEAQTAAAMRITKSFAAMYAATALAVDYGIVPWKKAELREALAKCMKSALASLTNRPDALKNAEPTLAAALKYIIDGLEHIRVVKIDPKDKPNGKQVKTRRTARAIRIGDRIYVQSKTFETWFEKSNRKAFVSVLQKHGILVRPSRSDTATIQKKIKGVPDRPYYYVLNRSGYKAARAEEGR